MGSVPAPACGGLCRLKPAFPAVAPSSRMGSAPAPACGGLCRLKPALQAVAPWGLRRAGSTAYRVAVIMISTLMPAPIIWVSTVARGGNGAPTTSRYTSFIAA